LRRQEKFLYLCNTLDLWEWEIRVPDSTGGKIVLEQLFTRLKRNVHNRWCRLKLLWADGGYETIVEWVLAALRLARGDHYRPLDAKGFVVIPRRWVVERTFGWFGRYRRLGRGFEHQVRSSEAMVYLASYSSNAAVVGCLTGNCKTLSY
jgi:putative transposase